MAQQPELFQHDWLYDDLSSAGAAEWANKIRSATQHALFTVGHGNLNDWTAAYEQLPLLQPESTDWSTGCVSATGTVSADVSGQLKATLQQFRPWRKGPFNLFGIKIDTEWRSDWKWDRLQQHVEFRDRRVLDVGCGNGYFGWRMLAAGAKSVLGLDPFLLYIMQHEVLKRYLGPTAKHHVLPLPDNCLQERLRLFDVSVSMGVLYHRTSPIDHLQLLHDSLKSNGQLLLETLVIDGPEHHALMPKSRYARMRNVWFIPTISMLQRWLSRTGFQDVKVIDVTATTTDEQRSTEWMTFESLPDFLDPHDQSKTIEGYPAPLRAMLTARSR